MIVILFIGIFYQILKLYLPYSICYNIITILYLHDRVEFKIRYEKMKSEFDKMTVNRVKNILREIDEEYPLSTNS